MNTEGLKKIQVLELQKFNDYTQNNQNLSTEN